MARLVPLALCILLAACGAKQEPAPAPPAPTPPPPVAVTPPPAAGQPSGDDWADRADTPGEWAYRLDERGSVALFGPSGGTAQFVLRCDRGRGRVFASRLGAFPDGETGMLTLRATTALKTYPASNTDGTIPYVASEIIPADAHLDAIAHSRGRFLVSVKGANDLVLPAWAEVARVVQDCR